MMPSVEVQKAIRARLVGASAVVALVPAANILDRHKRPVPYPSIILGEGQAVDEGSDVGRLRVRVFSELHIWTFEPSFELAATVAGKVHSALFAPRLELGAGFHCADCKVASARFLRDPSGDVGHVVVTVETLVHGVAI
jgi:hypothetical protein